MIKKILFGSKDKMKSGVPMEYMCSNAECIPDSIYTDAYIPH